MSRTERGELRSVGGSWRRRSGYAFCEPGWGLVILGPMMALVEGLAKKLVHSLRGVVLFARGFWHLCGRGRVCLSLRVFGRVVACLRRRAEGGLWVCGTRVAI